MKGRVALSSFSAVSLLGMVCLSGAHAQTTHSFNVPAEALDVALTSVGGTAHVNIVYPPAAVAGKRSSPLKGSYTTSEALQAVLAGTGLDYIRTESGSYIVRVSKPLAPPVKADKVLIEEASSSPYIPTIKVRGYKASLKQSLTIKRAYSGGIDSIVAEDIAKFPDNNVAEAIQRVAGIAITRDQGEGRTISVRGLGPEFTRVEINGLEAQAATDGATQGANKGRGFDFNVFPSELFSRIDVLKTSGADQPEGSLGATVNLMTPRPFDRRGLRMGLSVQTTYNDLSHRSGNRAAFLFSNTFGGGKFGLLLSAAYAYTPLDIQGVNSGGWNQGTGNGGFCKPTTGTGGLCDVSAADLDASLAAYNLANQATTYHPQFYRYTDLTGHMERLGATASFQWRPSDRTSLAVDGLFSRFHTQRSDHFIEAIGFSRGASQGGKPEIIPRQVVLDDHNTMVYGQFDNVDVRSELSLDNFTTDFHQISFLLKHKFTDKLFIELLGGSSRSDFDNFEELTVQIDRQNVDGYAFDTRAFGRNRPAITYGFDVTDPTNWYFGPRLTAAGGSGGSGPEIRLRPNFISDGYDILQTKLTYDANGHVRLSFGAQGKRYSYRAVAYRFDQGDADFPAPTVPLSTLTQVFCGVRAMSPPAGTPACWLEPNVGAFVGAYDLFSNTGRNALSTTNAAARGLNQAVTETDWSWYGKVWLQQTVLGRPIRGDIGIRHVETHQNAVFYTNVPASVDAKGFVLTTTDRTYSDLLPSLNIVYDLTTHSLLRFSAAKVMARPPLAYLAAATSVTVNGNRRMVTTGNPELEPFRATSLDLSYEWYPSPDGIVSVGLFYKDISTYIQNLTHIAPYSTTDLPVSLLANTGAAATDDFSISTVVNTPGGPLQGIELAYQQPFRFLPGFWSRFGTTINYTLVASKLTYQTTSAAGAATVRADLLNLSRNSYNATLYYDDGRLQARVSTNYRDKYMTGVPGSFSADASGVNPASYWDVSLSYRLTPRLAMTFEGLNLTDERSENWDNSVTRLVGDARLTGRQLSLGLRYTY